MSTACLPPAASLQITPAGFPPAALSSFPSKCSAVSSAASLPPDSRLPFRPAHSSSTDISYRSPNRAPSPPGCGYCSVTTGLSTPNRLSAGQNMCCAISALTLIASPLPTAGWLLLPTATSPSVGAPPLTPTRSGSCPCRSKSACAASCFTCCPAALCASATSASSLTGSEQNSFRSVSDCSSHPISPQQAPPRRPRSPLTHHGTVRSAAEPCRLSSASPPRNSSSDLRLIPAGARHESTSPASNLARASARTLVLCLAFLRMQYGCALQTLPCTAPRPFSLRPATETQALCLQPQTSKRSRPAHPDTNPIVPRGGFLQVAVSEAPLNTVSTPNSSLVGASDTALRLRVTNPADSVIRIFVADGRVGSPISDWHVNVANWDVLRFPEVLCYDCRSCFAELLIRLLRLLADPLRIAPAPQQQCLAVPSCPPLLQRLCSQIKHRKVPAKHPK